MSWCSSCEIWKMESLVQCLRHQRFENQTFSSSKMLNKLIIRINLPPNCRPSEMSSPSSTKFIFQETLTESRDVYVSPTVRQIVWEIPFYEVDLHIKSSNQIFPTLPSRQPQSCEKLLLATMFCFLRNLSSKIRIFCWHFHFKSGLSLQMTLFQWIFYSLICLNSAKKKPNILVILADDLGKNFILIFGQIQTWIFLQVTMTFLGITQIWSHRTCKN